jgi:hypothetical protein
MKTFSMRASTAVLALCVGLGLSATAKADTVTVGNDPTHQGALTDTCTKCAFVIGQAFGSAGATVTSYSFFTSGAAGDITPILYTESGSVFTIVGIGATQTLAAGSAGEETFSFNLQPGGVDVTTTNTFFGFSNANGSLVTYDNSTPTVVNGGADAFQLGGAGTPSLGETFNVNSGSTQDAYNEQLTRIYSIQASAVTPEPATLSLLALGISSLGAMTRFRRR